MPANARRSCLRLPFGRRRPPPSRGRSTMTFAMSARTTNLTVDREFDAVGRKIHVPKMDTWLFLAVRGLRAEEKSRFEPRRFKLRRLPGQIVSLGNASLASRFASAAAHSLLSD